MTQRFAACVLAAALLAGAAAVPLPVGANPADPGTPAPWSPPADSADSPPPDSPDYLPPDSPPPPGPAAPAGTPPPGTPSAGTAPLADAAAAVPSPAPAAAAGPVFCGFADVPYTEWFTTPACWMRERQLSSGTSPSTFSPTAPTSRGDLVVFLWRLAGMPAAADKVFADESQIPTSQRKAADWAWATRLVTGATFAATKPADRATTATLLWRNQGSPGLAASTRANTDGSTAVLWYDTTLAPGRTVTLPLHGAGVVNVDWGDGSPVQTFTNPNRPTKTYAKDGYYRVLAAGQVTGFGFTVHSADPTVTPPAGRHLRAVSSFGQLPLTDLSFAFYGAKHLLRVPARLPAGVVSLLGAFSGPASVSDPAALHAPVQFNDPAVVGWDTSKVTSLAGAFKFALAFNQPIGGWSTANVAQMTGMFKWASAFNQPLGGWNTARVANMAGTFNGASSFNQPLGGWATGNVTTFQGMFADARSFNQPLGSWNTVRVTNMRQTFNGASAFNQPIGGWNTARVTDMYGLFNGAAAFNQPIGAWSTAKVTDMTAMFAGASSFNRPLAGWNVAQVRSMAQMFSGARAFNQPLGGWFTANATTMREMFAGARAFNQNVSSWATARVSDWVGFRTGSALSTANTPPKFR